MNLQNFNFIQLFSFFFIILIVATINKKQLTFKGIYLVLNFTTFLIFMFCIFFWQYYSIDNSFESFNFKINSNAWTNINYEISFKVGSLSFFFIFLVIVIGLATNVYTLHYFKFEERISEFILLLNWFIFSMIFLVISNNFFTLLIGWELIGITSFLLINFWRFKITTLSCSFKAFVFNKISDIFLIIAFCLLWNTYKTSNIDLLTTLILESPYKYNTILFNSGLCIIIASSIKSAQIIGHLWLPDSMEAPVPASSLIHSATLVSAGIYLLLKFQIIFYYSNLYNLIFFIGAVTAFFGGVVASAQTDMKKLLAYSTISHCGFIFASISLNNFIVTITYLYLHGLYKALTFFCAGSLIKYYGTQDMRKMGNSKYLFLNTIFLIISTINLCGLPYTFGYLYKFLFLQFLIETPCNFFIYGFLYCGMLCSVIYAYKLIYYSCFDINKGFKDQIFEFFITRIIKNKYFFFNSTFLKTIAFFIIYLFSIFFFIIIKFFILKNFLYSYYSSLTFINDFIFLQNHFKLKKHIITIFYIFSNIVIIALILQNWRTNYFIIEKINAIYFFIIFFVFFSIQSLIFNKITILNSLFLLL